jgi:hypothetical protein
MGGERDAELAMCALASEEEHIMRRDTPESFIEAVKRLEQIFEEMGVLSPVSKALRREKSKESNSHNGVQSLRKHLNDHCREVSGPRS